MPLGDYWRILSRFWWILVVGIVIGAFGAFAYGTWISPGKYESTARLFVTAEGGTSVGESYQNNLFAQDRVNSYATIATSDQVAQRAAETLGNKVGAANLRDSVSAEPIKDTVILTITATSDNAERAQAYAQAVANATTAVVQELETSRRGDSPSATAVLYDDASLPSDKSGFSWWMWLLIGAFVGLLVGALVALGVGIYQRRLVDSESDAATAAESAGLLAEIPTVPSVGSRPVLEPVDSEYSDAYRRLDTSLRYLTLGRTRHHHAPRVITVAGQAAGLGTTTTALNLATSIADRGQRVLLIDADLHAHTLTSGMEPAGPTVGLTSVASGETLLQDAVVELSGDLDLLPTGPRGPGPWATLSGDGFAVLIQSAAAAYDYVVIDTAAIDAAPETLAIAGHSDGVVLVVRRGVTTRRALRSTAKSVAGVTPLLGVALTFSGSSAASRSASSDAADSSPENPPATEAPRTDLSDRIHVES